MAQVKIFGRRDHLDRMRAELSDVIHGCVMEALRYPEDKRFHRFFAMDRADLVAPSRGECYTIIEISMFEGRSTETKTQLLRLLIERCGEVGIPAADLEITITETPRQNWAFRAKPGDEHDLAYQVDV